MKGLVPYKYQNLKLKDEVELLASSIVPKDFQDAKKNEIIRIILKALENEESYISKKMLLETIKRIDWFDEFYINTYFNSFIIKVLEEYGNDSYFILKRKESGSNFNIIINFLKQGRITNENIINYYCIDNTKNYVLENKRIPENSTIIILDDYVGSGDTIIKIIDNVEDLYSNYNVIIGAYIWQKYGLEKIENYIKNSSFHNKYEINYEGIIYENNYKEKLSNNKILLDYVETICSGARNCKYGYQDIGAMLVIDGIAPNNNISMIWYDKIIYKGAKWIPIFNTEYNNQWIINHKERILKSSERELRLLYREFIYKNKYVYEEFIIILLLFNLYCVNRKKLKAILGVDTFEEVDNIIDKFVEDGIIVYDTNNILEFKDKVLIRQLRRFEEILYYDKNTKLLKKVSEYY